jgi:single-stranded-DNA-specific exonuclease
MRQFEWKPINISIPPQSVVSKISKQFKMSRVGSTVLLRRMVASGLLSKGYDPHVIKKFLTGSYKDLYDPYLFQDMLKAVSRVLEAKHLKHKIFIHGDYDCDGITGCAILKMTLDEAGVESVPYVPTRELGYGLSLEAVDRAHELGCRVIITCDCGSNEHQAHTRAKKHGMDVIVLDHHSYTKRPKVYAFINPEGPDYPFKDLCGAGVAFKFAQALDKQVRVLPERFMGLVAVATIADSVPLIDENRILVKEGFKRLRMSTDNLGMRHLLKVCSLFGKKPSSETVGFIIAPKINAAGRIDDPTKALELFLTNDEKKADELAHELARINKKRQEINTQIRDQAIEMIEKHYKNDGFIVLSNDKWHKGVIGIVASTIVEIYHKPACIISNGYGSVRTVPEFSLLEPVGKCSDLLDRWGGHPMAAGLKIKKKNIDAFRKRINSVSSYVLPADPKPYMVYDTRLKMRDIHMDLVEEMERMEPFGNGNQLPCFVIEDVHMARDRVTSDGQHLQMSIRKDNNLASAIGFWMAGHKDIFVDPAQRFDMLFFLERNRRGDYEQIVVKDIKEVKLNW